MLLCFTSHPEILVPHWVAGGENSFAAIQSSGTATVFRLLSSGTVVNTKYDCSLRFGPSHSHVLHCTVSLSLPFEGTIPKQYYEVRFTSFLSVVSWKHILQLFSICVSIDSKLVLARGSQSLQAHYARFRALNWPLFSRSSCKDQKVRFEGTGHIQSPL